jgi:hypothetical protein
VVARPSVRLGRHSPSIRLLGQPGRDLGPWPPSDGPSVGPEARTLSVPRAFLAKGSAPFDDRADPCPYRPRTLMLMPSGVVVDTGMMEVI